MESVFIPNWFLFEPQLLHHQPFINIYTLVIYPLMLMFDLWSFPVVPPVNNTVVLRECCFNPHKQLF